MTLPGISAGIAHSLPPIPLARSLAFSLALSLFRSPCPSPCPPVAPMACPRTCTPPLCAHLRSVCAGMAGRGIPRVAGRRAPNLPPGFPRYGNFDILFGPFLAPVPPPHAPRCALKAQRTCRPCLSGADRRVRSDYFILFYLMPDSRQQPFDRFQKGSCGLRERRRARSQRTTMTST